MRDWLTRGTVLGALLAMPLTAVTVDTALAGTLGPTSNTVFDEAVEKAGEGVVVTPGDDFDQFGWPATGRFDPHPGLTQNYIEANRGFWDTFGMTYMYAPTIMAQAGTQGGTNDSTASYQHQFLYAWRALNDTPIGTGFFVYHNLFVTQLSDTTGVQFANSLGINYFTTDSVAETDVVKALLWRHIFPGDWLMVQVGHVEISNLIGGCRYACDDTTFFLSTPLSANPASALSGQGAGILAELMVADGVYLEGGVSDARGDGNVNFDRPFKTNEWAYAAALRVENPFPSVGDGVYKVSYHHVEPIGVGTPDFMARTEGLTIQFDQDFGDVGVFGKYSRTWGRMTMVEQFAHAGLMWTRPFGYEEDRWGVGFGWVDPTADNTRDEYVAETFYRMQLTPFTSVTADAMLVINPSSNPMGNDTEGVFSLRTRSHF